MQSGIAVDDSCVTAFNDMKLKKASRYLIFQIEGETAIKVSSTGARDKTYDDFVAELGKEQPAYAVFDFDYDFEGAPRNKLLFISWIPDTAKIKAKTVYASTKDSLVQKIGSGTFGIQASDYSQVAKEAVLKKVSAATR
jgi:cofilin